MRKIHADEITFVIKQLCMDANYALRQDVITALQQALKMEKSELGREVIKQLLENADYAKKEKLPFCQDTGYAVLFIEIGQNIQLCMDANYALRQDVITALQQALKMEKSELGREVIKQLLENADYAKKEKLPFCQDTGYAVLFIEIGQNIHVEGSLTEAINEGVRQGYQEGYLRKSILKNPICRVNTGDNTPAIIHYDLLPGDKIKISLLVKGCGCDNMSALKMFTPTEGLDVARKFIVETIDKAGPNASPPVVIGVGLGGPFAQAAFLAQKALLWPIGQPNPDPKLATLEIDLLKQINTLGIGPAGYGGTTTALGLHIEAGATHMASFPVAVNIDCHSHRAGEVVI